MAKTLLIRADADRRIGAGHVMRCLALAQAWQDRGGQAAFMMKPGLQAIQQRLRENNISIYDVEASSGSHQDAQETVQTGSRIKADWIVVDGYVFKEDYQQVLKQHGHRILWMDDTAHAAIQDVDILVNQNIHADRSMYPGAPQHTVFLLGTQYVMLRREFLEHDRSPTQQPPKATRLLVTLGGGDQAALLGKIIQTAGLIKDISLEIRAVVGLAQMHNEEVQRAIDACPHTVELIYDVPSMPKLMQWADLAVSAGGSTCWELAYMGVPHLVVVLADNQQPIAQALHERGQAVSLGWGQDIDPHACAHHIEQLARDLVARARMSEQGQKMIDGLGAKRVFDEMLCTTLNIRPATIEDMDRVYAWSNEADTRRNSFSTKPIAWDDHVVWYQNKMNDPSCFFYICEDQNHHPIGQVRFDVQSDQAVVSVNLSKDQRGRGVGGAVIRKGVRQVLKDAHPRAICAMIKPANAASIYAFRRAGFYFDQDMLVDGVPAKKYVLTNPSA